MAQSNGGWFAGGMLGGGGLAYGGVTLALPGARLGEGPALRFSGYNSDYEYLSGTTRINGADSSAQAILLDQVSGAWGYINLGGGAQFINTNLSPPDPGNPRHGARFDATLDTDGAVSSNAWRADWYANYGLSQRDFQLLADVTRAVSFVDWRLGVLGGVQGDPDYSRTQLGAMAIHDFASGLELRVSGGATFQGGRGTDGYVSLAASQPF
jgi:hypothetical protein